jgi:hypothetical protein
MKKTEVSAMIHVYLTLLFKMGGTISIIVIEDKFLLHFQTALVVYKCVICCEFWLHLDQSRNYTIGIWCFSIRRRNKSKDFVGSESG